MQNTSNSAMTSNSQTVTAKNSDFVANLTGSAEVPPVQTNATGTAYFKINKDSTKLMYTVKLSNADSVIAAHIHYAPSGENGPPVAWLYPSPTKHKHVVTQGTVNGVLKSGTLTSANLLGPLKGATIKDLIRVINHDSAYVNVHNKAHKSGLIRGQIHASNNMMSSDSSSSM